MLDVVHEGLKLGMHGESLGTVVDCLEITMPAGLELINIIAGRRSFVEGEPREFRPNCTRRPNAEL
jgi:hypothetical protein